MDELERKLREQNGNLTFEEILEILEEEMDDTYDNPYRPLNFHEDDESFEE